MSRLVTFILLTCLPALGWSAQYYKVQVTGKTAQSRGNFVQGLEIVDGHLYVSTGLYGQSRLLRYRFPEGTLDHEHKLDARIFAEGLTVLGERIYQLTWKKRKMLVYRKSDLRFLKTLPIGGEGWGLANDGKQLIYSDGSATLRFIDPETAQVQRNITVTYRGQPVKNLNELEWIDGAIWANVWGSNNILIIDPQQGEVTGVVDLRGLLPNGEYRASTDVLNGIARDPADGSIWVTGKRWPWLYQVELVPNKRKEQRTDNRPGNPVE